MASVLLVDDQPDNLIALSAVLEPLGHESVQARSGHEALKLLLKQRFAVILLDVQMPGLDGFETARLIKQRERTRHLPIIFLTALSKDAEHITRGYAEGAVDYVLKPFEPEILRAKVAAFIALHEKSVALEESEQRFRSAFSNAPSGMALLSREGAVSQVNRALGEMLGRPQADLTGRAWGSLLGPDEGLAARELQQLAITSRGVRRGEFAYRRPDGADRTLAISVAPTLEGAGPLILQAEDVTEDRIAQRERAARAEAEARAEVAAAVQRVSDAALAHLTLDLLLPELVTRVAEAVGAQGAGALLTDDDERGLALRAATGAGFAEPGVRLRMDDGSVASRVARERKPLLVIDAKADGYPLARDGAGSMMVAPMVNGGELEGILCVTTPTGELFGGEGLALLSLIADRAAQAISNARAYDREHRVVVTLQRSLLPARLPQLPGMAVAAKYLPGNSGTVVGGDWYDAIVLEGGRVGLAMGDVVGHGIDAAALMAELRHALRAYAVCHTSPAEVVARLDDLLQRGGRDQMATLVYAVVEPDWSHVTLISAGHPPPLVLGPDGEAEYIWGGRSTPLGAEIRPDYAEAEVDLAPGSTLLLYTDGLVEVRGENLDAGLVRLKQAADGDERPQDLCDRLESAMVPGGVDDDVAMLAFRSLPLLPERLRLTPPADPEALLNVRHTLARWLRVVGASEREIDAIKIACHEACANVVEHAYAFGSDSFEIEAVMRDGDVWITVSDHGSWRDAAPGDRGRGITIMRAEMDEVGVLGGASGTVVEMHRTLEHPAIREQAPVESTI